MHVQELYREMQDRGLSARTIQYSPLVKRGEMRPLNRDQTRALLKAAERYRLKALYILAVHTGMRPGEVLALKWG